MAYFKNAELLPERRGIAGVVSKSLDQSEQKSRAYRRGRSFGRISRQGLLFWLLSLGVLLFIYLAYFGLKMHFHGERMSLELHDLTSKNFLLDMIILMLNTSSSCHTYP